MRRVATAAKGQLAVRLLYGLTIGISILLAIYAAGGLSIALGLTLLGWWPDGLVTTTPISRFTFPTTTDYGRLLYLTQVTTRVALLAALFVPLLGLLRSVTCRTPFTAANVARLRIMAAPFIVAALGQALAPLSGSVVLMVVADVAAPTIALFPTLSALALIVIAEVFAEGVRLRDDVDATI